MQSPSAIPGGTAPDWIPNDEPIRRAGAPGQRPIPSDRLDALTYTGSCNFLCHSFRGSR
jgi:hypothetical protein